MGHESHSITLNASNWRSLKADRALSIKGSGHVCEGDEFTTHWHFGGGLRGSLLVEYTDTTEHVGVGYDVSLTDAIIEER
jgi:hypothetical protein